MLKILDCNTLNIGTDKAVLAVLLLTALESYQFKTEMDEIQAKIANRRKVSSPT